MFPSLSIVLNLNVSFLVTVYVIVPLFDAVVNDLVVHASFSYHWYSFIPDPSSIDDNSTYTFDPVQLPGVYAAPDAFVNFAVTTGAVGAVSSAHCAVNSWSEVLVTVVVSLIKNDS